MINKRTLRHSDVVAAGFVIAITALLLVPLPTWLLDFLLVINLSFSLILLLTSLYVPNVLALLSFPTILLLTTLFRLSLNVASTRLILSQGDAGKVISTFGTLLIGGEIVVGVIIFSIITIGNFIIIAKGAGRVSEVAARFALDALPGKQMAIDSDLRSGIITAEQSQTRREDLRKESQLYGAMDGAMKFVQGDVIAGIIVIFVNILGGLYLGMVNRNLSFQDAIRTYTTLTVGDGLVHQIPALLISICAGIVVTRVSASDQSTLGGDVVAQLFTRPGTLLFAGLLLITGGVVADLPKVPFIGVGLALVGIAWYLRHKPADREISGSTNVLELPVPLATGLLPAPRGRDDEDEARLVIALDSVVLFKLYRLNAQSYAAWWSEMQGDFYQETGLHLPSLRVVGSDGLQSSSFAILVGGTTVERESVLLDSVLAEVNPENAPVFGLDVAGDARHPVDGSRICWVTQSPLMRRVADVAGIRTFDFLQYAALRAAAYLYRHPEELLSVAEVHSQLRQIEKKYPGLISDAFGQAQPNVARLTEIVQALSRDGVSVRDFRQIIESIAAYCASHRVSLGGEEDISIDDLVSYIRVARKRSVVGGGISGRRTLKVISVGDDVNERIRDAEREDGSDTLSLTPEDVRRIRAGIENLVEPLRTRGILKVSVLCPADIRAKIASLIRVTGVSARVLAFEELDPTTKIESVGVWELAI